MCDMCSSREYHSARKCKESLAFIFICHRCLHFRLHTGGDGCLVVELASLVVSCGGNRPPTIATNQCFDWRATRVTRLVVILIICVCVFRSRRGYTRARDGSQLTTWTHYVSSCYAVISEPSSLWYAAHVC